MAAEKAGVPSVSVAQTGFVRQAYAVARGLGVANPAVAEYPGDINTDSPDQFRSKIEEVLVDSVIEGFGKSIEAMPTPVEPGPRDIVCAGTLDEVQEFFEKRQWTDGLPIVPPTIEKVEQFLRFTGRDPSEVLGVHLPDSREATVWSCAVNGVMAGCRPEYMPILIAAVEAISEPEFRIQDAGSRPAWEPLIILSGPMIKQLGFNYESGVMRVGRRANTSVGRFLRLYMRNIPGFREPPGTTDKGCFGYTFNVALPEHEDAVRELGWPPFSVDRGFAAGDNVVTVQSVTSISTAMITAGNTALDHVDVISEIFGQACAYKAAMGAMYGKWHPLLVLSPNIAKVIAQDGWTKDDMRRYFYEHARIPARMMARYPGAASFTQYSPADVRSGYGIDERTVPKEYYASQDPERLLPVFMRPEWIGIVVAGDPAVNHSKGYVSNHEQGVPISKKVELPAAWERLLKEHGGPSPV